MSPVTTYPLAGVAVAASSSPTLLTLEAVSSATAGLYKCEVSGGPPRWRLVMGALKSIQLTCFHRFKTDVGATYIQIIDLPAAEPRILGAAPSYRPGDILAVLCVSPLSRPPARLRW